MKLTIAWVSPATALTPVATSGGAVGVTAPESAEAAPVPTEFVALTVKVYGVSLLSPVIVIGEAGPLATMGPGSAVTVYPVTCAPPSDAGAVKLTDACALPAVAFTPEGAPGSVGGGTNVIARLLPVFHCAAP